MNLKKYNITAYAEESMAWGEECYRGVLNVQESQSGQWVKAEDVSNKEAIAMVDNILNHAAGIFQCIGHIRSGSNVTPNELWSACDSLDRLFTAANKAKSLLK